MRPACATEIGLKYFPQLKDKVFYIEGTVRDVIGIPNLYTSNETMNNPVCANFVRSIFKDMFQLRNQETYYCKNQDGYDFILSQSMFEYDALNEAITKLKTIAKYVTVNENYIENKDGWQSILDYIKAIVPNKQSSLNYV